MAAIKHIWFDVEKTITAPNAAFEKAHEALLYRAFAETTGEPDSPALRQRYQQLYAQIGTVSGVFRHLG